MIRSHLGSSVFSDEIPTPAFMIPEMIAKKPNMYTRKSSTNFVATIARRPKIIATMPRRARDFLSRIQHMHSTHTTYRESARGIIGLWINLMKKRDDYGFR